MLNKLKQYLNKQKEEIKQKEDLKKQQTYLNLCKAGATFIQLVQQDIKENATKMNREQRRRMEHDLNKKGVLTEEIVNYYKGKLDWVLGNIHVRLNTPVQSKQDNTNVRVSREQPTNA